MNWVIEGMSHVIEPKILTFLTWQEIEVRACGPREITTEAL